MLGDRWIGLDRSPSELALASARAGACVTLELVHDPNGATVDKDALVGLPEEAITLALHLSDGSNYDRDRRGKPPTAALPDLAVKQSTLARQLQATAQAIRRHLRVLESQV